MGQVVRARGWPTVRLTGPAVETGVPFGGEAVGLRVQCTDGAGRSAGAVLASCDLKVVGHTVRLRRPVSVPRLRLAGRRVVVAFKLREFQLKVAPPFPARYEVRTPPHDGTLVPAMEVRRRGSKSPRVLWRLKDCSLRSLTWDGRHAWVLLGWNLGLPLYQLRRLSDGAVVLSCKVLPCNKSVSSPWLVFEGTFLCKTGCCMCEPGSSPVVVRQAIIQPGNVWLRTARLSPAGDRLVFQRHSSYDFYELSTRRPAEVRRLDIPPTSYAVTFQLTAAGEVVWWECGSLLLVCKEGRPEARTLEDVRGMTPQRSHLLQLITDAGIEAHN